MAYFAAGLARYHDKWNGRELDLDQVEDLDGVVDLLRDLLDENSGVSLMFLEENDEYFAVVRIDDDSDPRVFISDRRASATSDLAASLFEDAPADIDDVEPDSDDEDEETPRPEPEAGGDPEILADLGTPKDVLLDLSNEEGMLPGDVISSLCERAGCIDALEDLRAG